MKNKRSQKKRSYDISTCAKCLLVNCNDESCEVHTKQDKKSFRKKYVNSGYKNREIIAIPHFKIYWHGWHSCKKITDNLNKSVYNKSGVYEIRHRNSKQLLHIGKADNLKRRISRQLAGHGRAGRQIVKLKYKWNNLQIRWSYDWDKKEAIITEAILFIDYFNKYDKLPELDRRI